MDYNLIKDAISLVEDFETANHRKNSYNHDLAGFKLWIYEGMRHEGFSDAEPDWEGKERGRSPESVINTLIVHLNRYAKTYSRSAIHGSDFSTQEEFSYLINLAAFGSMTKMQLIKKNIQDKPAGIQIINRLIAQGWVEQADSETDRRSKIIRITVKGSEALDKQMKKIRQATQVVTGDLTHQEKMELIRLLSKLDRFHHPIYERNFASSQLLDMAINEYLPAK